MWQTCAVNGTGNRGSVVVAGSGLAGLSCALEAAAAGWQATVVTPGRAGRDGASHRVHLLAPWILLTAPRVKGDSPKEFAMDLYARGGGLDCFGLPKVYAAHANQASREIVDMLELEPLDPPLVMLPGDVRYQRGLRCVPRRPGALLAPLVERCREAGVRFMERTLVTGLRLDEAGGVAGAVAIGRDGCDEPVNLYADAVVLACGGAGGAYPLATAPRWCRGSGFALAASAGALLHHPHLLQALPVALRPRGYFPGSRVLLDGVVWMGTVGLSKMPSLAELTRTIAEGLESSQFVTPDQVVLEPADPNSLPEALRRNTRAMQIGRIPIGLAVHHTVGGVAIDEWGRTSVPGLYACGEAAGGVQGRQRTMGTGLIEACIFGVRAGQAVSRDAGRLRGRQGKVTVSPGVPLQPAGFERYLDQLLSKMAVMISRTQVEAVWQELFRWPTRRLERYDAVGAAAGLRRWAIMEVLESARRAASLQDGSGEGA